MSLEHGLNKHFKIVLPYQTYKGAIPLNAPAIRKDGRTWAGGDIVLVQRVNALESKDSERINAWGNQFYDLSDACIVFEDKVKPQPNSPLLKGIRGVALDGDYVAVDAKSVEDAIKSGAMEHFKVTESATVQYKNDGKLQNEIVENIVLLPYDRDSIKLNSDQYDSIDAKEFNRKDFIHGRDMEESEIVKDGKVIHDIWGMYEDRIIVPLVKKVFAHNKEEHGYDTNMGVFLPSETKDKAKMRAFYVNRLGDGSRFDGYDGLGSGDSCLLGVVENAEGVAQKLEYAKPAQE